MRNLSIFFCNRNRIKLLQSENERLDKSFNTYLEQQSSTVGTIQKDVSSVWASYNVDRLLLEKRRNQNYVRAPPQVASEAEPHHQQQRQEAKFHVPDIRIDECKSNLEVGQLSIPNIGLQGGAVAAAANKGCEDVSGQSVDKGRGNNSSGEFSNPFINFDVKKFLESTTKHNKEESLGPEGGEQEERHNSIKSTE